MNKRQTNHYRMMLNTQSTLDANTAVWNAIPIIVNTKNEFDELILRIAEKNEETNPESEPVTADKESVLEGLAQKTVALSGILQAYGAITGDNVLAETVKVVKSDITHARETDVEPKVLKVTGAARARMPDLVDYNVTDAGVTEVETSLDQYIGLIGDPRNIRNQAFAAIAALDGLIDTAMDLLNNRLDKLMLQFESTHPEFYDEYLRARTIVD